MSEAKIAEALRARLNSTPNRPSLIAWENMDATPPGDLFWSVQLVIPPADRMGIANARILRGRMIVAVMAQQGTYTAAAEASAGEIVAHFPPDLRLTFSGGDVTVVMSSASDGRADAPYWRTDVHVRWEAVL